MISNDGTRRFQIGSVELFAKHWGTPGKPPIIAIHGWLDNCASFDYLAPHLQDDYEIIALDCAGHGQSGHRTHLGAYNLWQDVIEVFAVADQLGWEKFSLMGHSRGAMVAFLGAGTLPDRITSTILLEGICPRVALPTEVPNVLAETIKLLKTNSKRPKQYYSSFELAVSARVNGIFPISAVDAQVLANHGVAKSESGYTWEYDPKLMAGSEIRMSIEQVNAFRDRLPEGRVYLAIAEQGLLFSEPALMAWLGEFESLEPVVFPGSHHFHMHEQAGPLAESIVGFLSKK